ncbi:hypothetical protein D3C78_1587410 [compost metagenome]
MTVFIQEAGNGAVQLQPLLAFHQLLFDCRLRFGITVDQQLAQQVVVVGVFRQPFHVPQVEHAQMRGPNLMQQSFNFALIVVDGIVTDAD